MKTNGLNKWSATKKYILCFGAVQKCNAVKTENPSSVDTGNFK